MSPENEFYDDMDRKTARRSCCTFPTMIILFVLMALVVGGLTYYLVSKIRMLSLPSKGATENFSNKFQLNPEVNPTFSIPISAEDLNSIVGGILSIGAFQIQNLEFSINELGIENNGELVKLKLVKFHLKMLSIPEISDGKVKLKVQKVMVSRLNLPGYFRTEIEKSLNNLMDENFATLYENYQATDVKLEQDQMIISGKLK